MRCAFAAVLAILLPLSADAESITVSAAISLKDALQDVAAQYKKETGDDVSFNFGASGTLLAQVKNGAPVDAFVSAADAQVTDLIDAGLADRANRRVVAANDLVLIVPAGASNPPKDFASLADARVKKVAIGDPKVVPAGQYATEAIKALKLDDQLTSDRLVYGANVRQVLAYVERGEVDAGLVYRTDAIASGDKVTIVATAGRATHKPIEYPAVILKSSHKQDAARRFLDYLAGEKGQQVLAARGFTRPAKDRADSPTKAKAAP